MLTDEQAQAIAAMHQPLTFPHVAGVDVTECQTCDANWPCHVAILLAERARLLAVVEEAEAFIEDSEDQGGPPPEACNACYWNLRSAVRAYQAAPGGAGERDADG